jgi:hypothetical protein
MKLIKNMFVIINFSKENISKKADGFTFSLRMVLK